MVHYAPVNRSNAAPVYIPLGQSELEYLSTAYLCLNGTKALLNAKNTIEQDLKKSMTAILDIISNFRLQQIATGCNFRLQQIAVSACNSLQFQVAIHACNSLQQIATCCNFRLQHVAISVCYRLQQIAISGCNRLQQVAVSDYFQVAISGCSSSFSFRL